MCNTKEAACLALNYFQMRNVNRLMMYWKRVFYSDMDLRGARNGHFKALEFEKKLGPNNRCTRFSHLVFQRNSSPLHGPCRLRHRGRRRSNCTAVYLCGHI